MFCVFACVLSLFVFSQQAAIGKCPDDDEAIPTYFIDPTNCSRFYECNHGIPILISCPRNMVFDSKFNVCVSSPDGKCLPEVRENFKLSNQKLEDGPSLAKECPKEDGEWPTYLINPKNCSQYYECAHGRAYLEECPAGMEFNAKKLICDAPESAGCSINTDSIRHTFILASFNDNDEPSLAEQCPKEDGEYPTFLTNPNNCSQYYECSHGIAYLEECPPGMEFNAQKLVCDNPEDAGCSHKTEKMQEAFLLASFKNNNGPALADRCPREDGDWPTYLLDSTNCSRFYECSHGLPFLHACPPGLQFSPLRLVCDLAKNVNCTESYWKE